MPEVVDICGLVRTITYHVIIESDRISGTTYSGVAWAHTLKVIFPTFEDALEADIPQPEVQSIIQEWPDMNSDGVEGKTSDKVPT